MYNFHFSRDWIRYVDDIFELFETIKLTLTILSRAKFT